MVVKYLEQTDYNYIDISDNNYSKLKKHTNFREMDVLKDFSIYYCSIEDDERKKESVLGDVNLLYKMDVKLIDGVLKVIKTFCYVDNPQKTRINKKHLLRNQHQSIFMDKEFTLNGLTPKQK